MPKKMRWAYRRKRSDEKKGCLKNRDLTISISPQPPNVSPDTAASSEITIRKGQSSLKRELLGLGQGVREKRYTPMESGNRIIHWGSLQKMVCENTQCKFCGAPVDLLEHTNGVSTEVQLLCRNKNCGMHVRNDLKRTKYKEKKFRADSSESYALNCQFALGLMQIGCGNSESETLLNFLDLPHGGTFKRTTFSRLQSAVRSTIVKISDRSMEDARHEELKKTYGEEVLEKYKKCDTNPEDMKLTVSYDMGWNKRSSGHKYDSISGHGFVMGGLTKKIMNHRCLSKCCSICYYADTNKVEPPTHECPKNHDGSSKSMETEAIFRMVLQARYEQGYTIGTIISDDDSSMKANLKHSLKAKMSAGLMELKDWPTTKAGNKKADNGRLPLDIVEPKFLADFNHRVKTVGKRFYELAGKSKRDSEVDNGLARRMKLNWSTMMKQVRYMKWDSQQEEIKQKMNAPIEHLFGNHKNCGSWCYFLKAEREGKKYAPANNLPIYCKKVNNKTYQQLTDAVKCFQEEENVKECLHNFDTQQNEALNMAVSRYVPKFKHYGTTMALDTRIRCVISSHNMGYRDFYLALLTDLGCTDDNNLKSRMISSGIAKVNDTRIQNKKRKQLPSVKRKRQYGVLAKTKQEIFEQRVDRANKLGTYQSGIAIDDGNDTQQSSTKSKKTG